MQAERHADAITIFRDIIIYVEEGRKLWGEPYA